jgi:amino acid permease
MGLEQGFEPMRKFLREILIPAGMMASLIIGAGMFSLPFVFANSGIVAGIIFLVLMFLVMAETHKSYAEVIDQSGEAERFVCYAYRYLGKSGKILGGLSVIAGTLISLTIYLVLSASFIRLIFPFISPLLATILFWIIGSLLFVSGLKMFAEVDVLFFIGIAVITGVLAVYGLFFGRTGALSAAPFKITGLMFPVAPFLFAFAGRSAISSIKEYFSSKGLQKDNFVKSIIVGTAIPVVVYGLFVVGIAMLSPAGISEDAVSGLTLVPSGYLFLLGILGFLSLITSYIFIGAELKNIAEKDFLFSGVAAALITIAAPIVLYLLGLNNFIILVGIAGGVFLATEGTMVILMRRAATLRKSPWDFAVVSVFVLALVLEVLSLFK